MSLQKIAKDDDFKNPLADIKPPNSIKPTNTPQNDKSFAILLFICMIGAVMCGFII